MPSPNPEPGLVVQRPVSGPSFGLVYRLTTALVLLGLVVWGVRLAWADQLTGLNREWWVWGSAAYALLGYMGWVLLRGVTVVSKTGLEQTWFWKKSVVWEQVSGARLLRIRGWEWLIAPRLYVRHGPGPLLAFHVGSPDLWAAAEQAVERVHNRQLEPFSQHHHASADRSKNP